MPIETSPQRPGRAEREGLLTLLDRALETVESVSPLDDARFLETHVLYEGRSDQQRRIIEWFGARIAPGAGGTPAYRVLSVGCGSGILDVPVAEGLAAHAHQLRYVGVDPNALECADFLRRFREASIEGARVEVVAEPFGGFQPARAFDLVHMVHCLYYLPDAAAALEEARRLLAPGGRLVVLHAPRGALNALAGRFYDRLGGVRTPFSEDLERLFDRWGWSFTRERVDARVDVTPLLHGDPQVAIALRDFIVQADTRRLPPRVVDLVDRYLRLVSEEDRRGRSFIPHPVDAFLIDG